MHDDELITIKEACRLLGGNERPIHNATYYRGVIIRLQFIRHQEFHVCQSVRFSKLGRGSWLSESPHDRSASQEEMG
jgi:hypothetical protein